MPETYKATLRGNQLEWNGETPEFADEKSSVEVIVTIPEKNNAEELRPFGLCAGEFTAPEDFDAPMPDETLADFEN
jgi:hypothetical protein